MQDLLINVLMWIIKTLSSIFISPIILLVKAFIPDLTAAINSCQYFLSEYVFKGALFCKQVFINCTGISQTVLTSLFLYLALKVTLWAGMQVYKLMINIWKLVKP